MTPQTIIFYLVTALLARRYSDILFCSITKRPFTQHACDVMETLAWHHNWRCHVCTIAPDLWPRVIFTCSLTNHRPVYGSRLLFSACDDLLRKLWEETWPRATITEWLEAVTRPIISEESIQATADKLDTAAAEPSHHRVLNLNSSDWGSFFSQMMKKALLSLRTWPRGFDSPFLKPTTTTYNMG